MSKPQIACDCGCGVKVYWNHLKPLDINIALDETLRETRTMRRFYVRDACRKDFIRELQAQHMLEQLVRSYIRVRAPWWRKLWHMRRVVKLQFIIHSRLKGIDICKRQSLRSGILFVVPNWMGKYLTRYWIWANKNELVWRYGPIKKRAYRRSPETKFPAPAAQSHAAG